MDNFVTLRVDEIIEVDGGCTWCKVGGTLITVGGVLFTGVSVPSVIWGVVSIATIWIS